MQKQLILVSSIIAAKASLAVPASAPVKNSLIVESAVTLTESEVKQLKKLAEREKLTEYSGVLGTAPVNKTISSTGAALEETQTGPQVFIFWTQTLSNGLYYEARLYGKDNLRTQNPAFPDVPPSAIDNPSGYKGVFKLGYNFHVTDNYNITPYLRLEAGNDMTLVYADTNGNNITSTNYAILPGFKQTFQITNRFAPYIDIFGGISQVSLQGSFTEGTSANQNLTGTVTQYQLTTEFGFAYKITEHQYIIPYMQFAYNINNTNAQTAAPFSEGGFNVNELATNQQVYAIKYSYSW